MIERVAEDRRIKKLKIDNNQRKNLRRKEDIANNNAYNLVFYFISSIVALFGLLSFIWGR